MNKLNTVLVVAISNSHGTQIYTKRAFEKLKADEIKITSHYNINRAYDDGLDWEVWDHDGCSFVTTRKVRDYLKKEGEVGTVISFKDYKLNRAQLKRNEHNRSIIEEIRKAK